MSTKAIILIEIVPGKVRAATEAVRKLDGVISVDTVAGPYDAIAVMEAHDLTQAGHVITTGIQPIAGISRTIACIAQ